MRKTKEGTVRRKTKEGAVQQRVRQPSSSAGLAAGLSPFVAFLPPQYQLIGGALVAALGALAVYLPETGGK